MQSDDGGNAVQDFPGLDAAVPVLQEWARGAGEGSLPLHLASRDNRDCQARAAHHVLTTATTEEDRQEALLDLAACAGRRDRWPESLTAPQLLVAVGAGSLRPEDHARLCSSTDPEAGLLIPKLATDLSQLSAIEFEGLPAWALREVVCGLALPQMPLHVATVNSAASLVRAIDVAPTSDTDSVLQEAKRAANSTDSARLGLWLRRHAADYVAYFKDAGLLASTFCNALDVTSPARPLPVLAEPWLRQAFRAALRGFLRTEVSFPDEAVANRLAPFSVLQQASLLPALSDKSFVFLFQVALLPDAPEELWEAHKAVYHPSEEEEVDLPDLAAVLGSWAVAARVLPHPPESASVAHLVRALAAYSRRMQQTGPTKKPTDGWPLSGDETYWLRSMPDQVLAADEDLKALLNTPSHGPAFKIPWTGVLEADIIVDALLQPTEPDRGDAGSFKDFQDLLGRLHRLTGGLITPKVLAALLTEDLTVRRFYRWDMLGDFKIQWDDLCLRLAVRRVTPLLLLTTSQVQAVQGAVGFSAQLGDNRLLSLPWEAGRRLLVAGVADSLSCAYLGFTAHYGGLPCQKDSPVAYLAWRRDDTDEQAAFRRLAEAGLGVSPAAGWPPRALASSAFAEGAPVAARSGQGRRLPPCALGKGDWALPVGRVAIDRTPGLRQGYYRFSPGAATTLLLGNFRVYRSKRRAFLSLWREVLKTQGAASLLQHLSTAGYPHLFAPEPGFHPSLTTSATNCQHRRQDPTRAGLRGGRWARPGPDRGEPASDTDCNNTDAETRAARAEYAAVARRDPPASSRPVGTGADLDAMIARLCNVLGIDTVLFRQVASGSDSEILDARPDPRRFLCLHTDQPLPRGPGLWTLEYGVLEQTGAGVLGHQPVQVDRFTGAVRAFGTSHKKARH